MLTPETMEVTTMKYRVTVRQYVQRTQHPLGGYMGYGKEEYELEAEDTPSVAAQATELFEEAMKRRHQAPLGPVSLEIEEA